MYNKIVKWLLSRTRRHIKYNLAQVRSADMVKRAQIAFVPLLVLVFLFLLAVIPGTAIPNPGAKIKTFRVANYPLVLVLEQRDGSILSAWLRTPASTLNIEQLDGLFFISDGIFLANVDGDNKEDLLWRLSFTNFEGFGTHLWVGMTTQPSKIFIDTSPYQYTRWDAVPAKISVPLSTALYVSPATPTYHLSDTFSGRDSYSFVYTIKLTPEGPAFVPVPDVYRQLSMLLGSGMRGETKPLKHLTYVKMLTEFNRLAEGKTPQTATLLNLQMQHIATLSWKR